MLHYIYKIIFLQGSPEGRYYLGKRSFGGDDIAKDTYSGSGSFCKAYFKACGKKLGETYLKEIVEANTCAKINASREAELIGELIEEFDTPTKAGNSVGVPYQYIQYAIKTGRVHYGYY